MSSVPRISLHVVVRWIDHLRALQAMIGDGQVSMGSMVVKPNARKVRRIGKNVIAGFAGSTADAYTLIERLEQKLEEHPGQEHAWLPKL